MQAVWRLPQPAATGDIRRVLIQTRPWKLAAVQMLLGRLEGRGFLTSARDGRDRVYTALVEEASYLRHENARFLKRVNRGSLEAMIASLVENNSVSEEDITALRRYLDERT